MGLPTRPLGRSGMEITEVGFGAWAIGGGEYAFGWGPQDDEESIRAIRYAVDAGVNWIDTAPAYGMGRSEEVVGRALEDIPEADRPLIFTKCGVHRDPNDLMGKAVRHLEPDAIRRECDDSLRRLGVEQIDLYQFHWPDEQGNPIEASWEVMVELQQAGKIRAAGVSNFGVDLLEACESISHVDSLQPPLSLIRRDGAGEAIPWCERNGTGVIVYSPMQSGLLTGAFSAERVANLPDDDWRRNSAEFNEPNLSRNLELLEAMRPIAENHGVSLAAVAVAWTLAWPGVTAAIVGARRPDQIDGWIPAAGLELEPDELDELAAVIERTGAGSGPTRP